MQHTVINMPHTESVEPNKANVPMRILIADSEWQYRSYIRKTLGSEPGFMVIGEAADSGEVVLFADQLHPDVVMMDMDLQGGSFDATRKIKARLPGIRIVMHSVLRGEIWHLAAAKCGVDAFVTKNAPISKILEVIRSYKPHEAA